MDLNQLFMQRMNLERQNRIDMQPEINSSLGNLLGSVVGSGLQAFAKQKQEQQDEQNRMVRTKDQITKFQSMMEQMNSMPDNSSAAKGVGVLSDDVNKDRKGITGITRMIPQQEMSVDENGAVNIKLGMRATTPQEQKAQFDIQKSQMEQQKAEAKSSMFDGYIRGDIQEGAILKEMGNLDIKPEEFDMATQARERFRQVSQIQAQQQAMAQNQPQMSMQQPQDEQPFMFKPQQKRTDTQNTASIFANRAEEAEGVFSKLDNYISEQGFDKFTAKIAPNFLKGADQQMYEQAQRNFVNAVLRKESGAVIADSEFKNAEIQYFPQPGDTPEVIKQKADNRRTQIEGLKVTAGKALGGQGGRAIQSQDKQSVGKQQKVGRFIVEVQ